MPLRWRRTGGWIVATAVALSPSAGHAHSPVPGMGALYQGLLHPLLEIDQAMAIAALGLFMGQQALGGDGRIWLSLIGALALGLVAAWTRPLLYVEPWTILALALALGGLAAVGRPLPRWSLMIIAAGLGVVIGIMSMPAPADRNAMSLFAGGAIVGTFLLAFYVYLASRWANRLHEHGWLAIGTRVIGSWIAAVAVMMLAFRWRLDQPPL